MSQQPGSPVLSSVLVVYRLSVLSSLTGRRANFRAFSDSMIQPQSNHSDPGNFHGKPSLAIQRDRQSIKCVFGMRQNMICDACEQM